jgi:uncharacterized membrane protein YphA (DoxX/SURF4 family)
MPFTGLGTSWTRFWHTPVRAERLAFTRILFGLALLTDQLIQYLPNLDLFFGPEGIGPAGLYDRRRLFHWHWTIWFFNTDAMPVVRLVFAAWVAVTVAFLLGWHTRVVSVLLWLLTLCIHNRNRSPLNFGDNLVEVGLFLMMLSPAGRAFSLDRWRERQRGRPVEDPPLTPAWPVRLLQIQLCMLYLGTGLAKLLPDKEWFDSSWWEGTSMYYVLTDISLSRWSYAEFPVPLWLTAVATYVSVWWEVLFTPLVLFRRTRKWALWGGIFFHLGIFLVLEAGWFSCFSLAYYGVWVPGEFWDRFFSPRGAAVNSPGRQAREATKPGTSRAPEGRQ